MKLYICSKDKKQGMIISCTDFIGFCKKHFLKDGRLPLCFKNCLSLNSSQQNYCLFLIKIKIEEVLCKKQISFLLISKKADKGFILKVETSSNER